MHPDLAALLHRRLDLIADHDFRDRDAAGHLDALKEISEEITAWHARHRGTLPPRLEHFLGGCSYQKALAFLEQAPPDPK